MGAAFGVSYFGVRDLRHARRDLDEIAAAGFRAVTHTLSEHDLRHHTVDVGRLVAATRERGLEAQLDPWGVGGLFGGEADSELALTHPDARQVDAAGRSVPACCPNAPAVRDLLRRWTRTAADLGADVLFWDEPHFYLGAYGEARPVPRCCRCGHCRSAWSAAGGAGELPAEGDAALEAFRTRSLRDLLAECVAAAPETVRHSVCLLPRGEYAGAGTDAWEPFADVPGIARLATDPYWMSRPVDPAAFVRRHSAPLRPLCDARGAEMEIWIQGIRIPAGSEAAILAATEAAVESGADRIAYWSFRGTAAMSSLACGDPDAAWAAMCEAVRRFG
jgi:hypothetical protein